jgi:hypothetical protein
MVDQANTFQLTIQPPCLYVSVQNATPLLYFEVKNLVLWARSEILGFVLGDRIRFK